MTGFLIAGTASGVGKTTATLAIAAALRARGKVVQLFKGGPDFLDTGHHSRVSGRGARNLDTWMMSHEANREVLRRGAVGADAVIVEGMMGLFDGKHAEDEMGSSAEIAKLLKLPVVLVVDAGKSARSVAAVVLGFETFDRELVLAGVILNRVASERHFAMLRTAIVARCATPVLGWMPREPSVAIAERHLGLQTAEEFSAADLERQREALARLAEGHLEMDRLMGLACGMKLGEAAPVGLGEGKRVRIGVARDAAFSFYYEDNFDLLREQGAEIVFFSPMKDAELPAGLDGLYFGGGYPELYAGRLAANAGMLQDDVSDDLVDDQGWVCAWHGWSAAGRCGDDCEAEELWVRDGDVYAGLSAGAAGDGGAGALLSLLADDGCGGFVEQLSGGLFTLWQAGA
jgi:cobyrinic acid a,c-diamide synthase